MPVNMLADDTDAQLDRAENFLVAGMFPEAATAAEVILRGSPGPCDAAAATVLAQAYHEQGLHAELRHVLAELVTPGPDGMSPRLQPADVLSLLQLAAASHPVNSRRTATNAAGGSDAPGTENLQGSATGHSAHEGGQLWEERTCTASVPVAPSTAGREVPAVGTSPHPWLPAEPATVAAYAAGVVALAYCLHAERASIRRVAARYSQWLGGLVTSAAVIAFGTGLPGARLR